MGAHSSTEYSHSPVLSLALLYIRQPQIILFISPKHLPTFLNIWGDNPISVSANQFNLFHRILGCSHPLPP